MTVETQLLTTPTYTEEDHATWAALYARQMEHVHQHASALFLEGLPNLGLDPQRLPDPHVISARLQALSGWTLGDAQNEYMGPSEWFAQIAERRFPVTNYIRQPHELEFTPLPDLFHEYFGHLALFTNRRFADIAQSFGPLYFAGDERQRLEIARLWWYTTEFGLIRENGQLKAFGAGLLSSPGELHKAFAPDVERVPFDIRRAATTPSAVYHMHDLFFILDDLEHIAAIVRQYTSNENLSLS
jgi:phenylalanine-4-hydroxylase